MVLPELSTPSFKWSQHLVPGPYETSLAHSDVCGATVTGKKNAQGSLNGTLNFSFSLTLSSPSISVSIYIHGTQRFIPETLEITSTSCKQLTLFRWLPGLSSLRGFKYSAPDLELMPQAPAATGNISFSALGSFYHLKTHFEIISTYENWRVTFLDKCYLGHDSKTQVLSSCCPWQDSSVNLKSSSCSSAS